MHSNDSIPSCKVITALANAPAAEAPGVKVMGTPNSRREDDWLEATDLMQHATGSLEQAQLTGCMQHARAA
jgi:hypothetical protein